MKKCYFKFLLTLTVILSAVSSNVGAQTCLSQGTGNWNNTSTWSCDGTSRLPACGDTIRVQIGHIVTVTDQYDFTACGITMALDVAGVLYFTTGNKIRLPCGSLLSLQTGGVVLKIGSGGGSSTLISICGTTVWSVGGTNPLIGPIAYGGDVLPIELLSFESSEEYEKTTLTWKTAAEIDNDFFTVYHSYDGIQWEQVIEVPGAGSSAVPLEYSIQLDEMHRGRSLYRLDQTDFDGTVESVGMVELNRQIKVIEGAPPLIYPNPSRGEVSILLASPEEVDRISIYSLQGQLMQQWTRFDSQRFTFDVNALGMAPGNYLLMLELGNQQQHQMLEVIR
ncbi:MAG: T9SS type A sorting domain-containing protein [Cryomorphaceae bacterium]